MTESSKHWPHAPAHQLREAGTFIVTAGTYQKQHFFRTTETLSQLHEGLLRYAARYEWRLEAWAVFSNHYHFVGHSPDGAEDAHSLSKFLGHFHSRSAAWLNRQDGSEGRKVWHNFWETKLTNQKSFLARLAYVHRNAVKHGLVDAAADYPWCSARWLESEGTTAQQKTLSSFRTDQIKVLDEFEPLWDK